MLGKNFDFNDLIKKVASKNGTTEKALNFLKLDNDECLENCFRLENYLN